MDGLGRTGPFINFMVRLVMEELFDLALDANESTDTRVAVVVLSEALRSECAGDRVSVVATTPLNDGLSSTRWTWLSEKRDS